MGFCSRCGEIAFADRCRCGGKVKGNLLTYSSKFWS